MQWERTQSGPSVHKGLQSKKSPMGLSSMTSRAKSPMGLSSMTRALGKADRQKRMKSKEGEDGGGNENAGGEIK